MDSAETAGAGGARAVQRGAAGHGQPGRQGQPTETDQREKPGEILDKWRLNMNTLAVVLLVIMGACMVGLILGVIEEWWGL